jgi:sulfate adenylyltransferase
VKEFTGVSDPYEAPEHSEVRIDTSDVTPEAAAQQIILHLQTEGYLGRPSHSKRP